MITFDAQKLHHPVSETTSFKDIETIKTFCVDGKVGFSSQTPKRECCCYLCLKSL